MENIKVIKGDITVADVEAVVNAANTSLLGGGGVDGAIHRAAGPQLLDECRALGGCRTGDAKITSGYRLAARYVIHTAGPVWKGGHKGEDELLASCYRQAMAVAAQNGIRSVAFPCISTGVYRFPKQRAAAIAVKTVREALRRGSTVRTVLFVCFSEEDYVFYQSLCEDAPAP